MLRVATTRIQVERPTMAAANNRHRHPLRSPRVSPTAGESRLVDSSTAPRSPDPGQSPSFCQSLPDSQGSEPCPAVSSQSIPSRPTGVFCIASGARRFGCCSPSNHRLAEATSTFSLHVPHSLSLLPSSACFTVDPVYGINCNGNDAPQDNEPAQFRCQNENEKRTSTLHDDTETCQHGP